MKVDRGIHPEFDLVVSARTYNNPPNRTTQRTRLRTSHVVQRRHIRPVLLRLFHVKDPLNLYIIAQGPPFDEIFFVGYDLVKNSIT